MLLYTTSLFLSREAFRKACIKNNDKSETWHKYHNIICLAIPLSLIVVSICVYTWVYVLEKPDNADYVNVSGILIQLFLFEYV